MLPFSLSVVVLVFLVIYLCFLDNVPTQILVHFFSAGVSVISCVFLYPVVGVCLQLCLVSPWQFQLFIYTFTVLFVMSFSC